MTFSDAATVVLTVAVVLLLVEVGFRVWRLRDRPRALRPAYDVPTEARPERPKEREYEIELPYADLSGRPPESVPAPPIPPEPPQALRSAPPAPPAPAVPVVPVVPAGAHERASARTPGSRAVEPPRPPSPPARPPRRPGVARILLIDRDPADQSASMRTLARAGYEIIRVSDAVEALVVYEAADPLPDLVVSEAYPAGMTGARLAERLRTDDPDLPVVLLSSFGPQAIQALAGVTVVPAPGDAGELLAAVSEALARVSVPHPKADER